MTVKELKAAIDEKSLSGAVIFCGEEEYLKRHYRRLVRDAVICEQDFASFNHTVFDGEDISFGELSDAALALPFMADKKLVEWTHADLSHLSKSENEALSSLCEKVKEQSDTVLLICATEQGFDCGTEKSPSALFKAYSSIAQIVRFDKSTDAQLLAWISRHFTHEGLAAAPAVCRQLLAICGHSMQDLAHEIDKIVCFVKQNQRQEVLEDDVRFVVCANKENDTYALTNALLAGKTAQAFEALSELKARRADTSLVMGQLIRFYADLFAVSTLAREGKNQKAVADTLKMNAYKTGLYITAARALTHSRIEEALSLCQSTDLYLKRTYLDSWGAIEKLVLRL
ncbi:MAG: DNA polymerase III subunit delta [Clostridia bacterium]|nr:DNA polymerase III subunit delta [Clostridia bacterium]